jgi:hypothetical protein
VRDGGEEGERERWEERFCEREKKFRFRESETGMDAVQGDALYAYDRSAVVVPSVASSSSFRRFFLFLPVPLPSFFLLCMIDYSLRNEDFTPLTDSNEAQDETRDGDTKTKESKKTKSVDIAIG